MEGVSVEAIQQLGSSAGRMRVDQQWRKRFAASQDQAIYVGTLENRDIVCKFASKLSLVMDDVYQELQRVCARFFTSRSKNFISQNTMVPRNLLARVNFCHI